MIKEQITPKYQCVQYLIKYIPAGYTRVTSGSTCDRVTSKAKCEEAARQLGFSDTEASTETATDYPPYCYFWDGQSLYFNDNGNSVHECNSNDRVCLCHSASDVCGKSLLISFTCKCNILFSPLFTFSIVQVNKLCISSFLD